MLDMPRDPDAAAGKIAARQCGLITWRQAVITAGLSERQVRWRISSKRWRRVQRGVYAVAGTAPSWTQSLLAAQLAARTELIVVNRKKQRLQEFDDAAVTGASALWLRGCKHLGKPSEHELLVARPYAPKIKGGTCRRTAKLPPADTERISGVLTLAVPRLLVDVAGQVSEFDLIAVVDDLLSPVDPRLRQETHQRAVELSRGRNAVRRLLELTAPDAAERFASWLERRGAELLHQALLPPPTWNAELRDEGGHLIGLGDAVWPAQRLVVEFDGLRFHSSDAERRRDRKKDRQLQMNGWLVLRYTWLDVVQRPAELVDEIRRSLEQRTGFAGVVGGSTDTECP